MSNREQPAQQLENLLRNEIHCTSMLLACLQKESSQLGSDNPALEPTDSEAKIQLITALQQATQARMKQMSVTGYAPATDRLAETVASLDEKDSLRPLFSQLAELAQHCFDENRLIGQMINRRAQFVTRMLDSLAPQSRNPHAETYGENGNTSSSANSRLINLAQ